MSRKRFRPPWNPNHRQPVTRREFLSQGLVAGTATVTAGSIFSLFADPHRAYATLAPDIAALKASPCNITVGAGMIPFIAFDLAGGGNIAGSNVLVGTAGSQLNFLSTAGYNRLGLPGNMIPNSSVGAGSFIDQTLGLAFHSDSAHLRGIKQRIAASTGGNVNGAVIPAISQNDTGTNPHNPLYGIHSAGAFGDLLVQIGSMPSISGGNSASPSYMIDPSNPPAVVTQPSDVTGLVNTGQLVGLLSQADSVSLLESIERISANKLAAVNTQLGAQDAVVKDLVQCGYVKTADLVDRYGAAQATLDPLQDTAIVGSSGIFTSAELQSSTTFLQVASIMKMVVNGYAGSGTIELGGYDYHTGDRMTGEARDFLAGQCIGACLEYAARKQQPLMIYVFSDGSVVSSGMIDNSVGGRGKGVWTSDNASTAASYFLVYNPTGRPSAITNQIGAYTSDGNVDPTSSPAANAVNLLAETVILNYLALHGRAGAFQSLLWSTGVGTGLGAASTYDSLIALAPIR